MPETLLDEVTQADRDAAVAFIESCDLSTLERYEQHTALAFARHRLAALATLQPSVSEMSDRVVERVARAICGMTGCQAGTPSVQCSSRRSCQGDLRDVLSEYGDAARAAIAALSPEGEP